MVCQHRFAVCVSSLLGCIAAAFIVHMSTPRSSSIQPPRANFDELSFDRAQVEISSLERDPRRLSEYTILLNSNEFSIGLDGTTVQVNVTLTYRVHSGSVLEKGFKSISAHHRDMPVSELQVRDHRDRDLNYQLNTFDDGVAKVEYTLVEPVNGLAEHTVHLLFTVSDGVCADQQSGRNFIPARWTGWWSYPVDLSLFCLSFSSAPLIESELSKVCAVTTFETCPWTMRWQGKDATYNFFGNPEVSGFSWPADMLQNNPKPCPEDVHANSVSGPARDDDDKGSSTLLIILLAGGAGLCCAVWLACKKMLGRGGGRVSCGGGGGGGGCGGGGGGGGCGGGG